MANKINVVKESEGVIVITVSSDVSPFLNGMRISYNDARLLRNKLDMLLNEIEKDQK